MDTLSLGELKNNGRSLDAILRLGDSRLWRRVALSAILLLAAGLLFYKLDALGYANHYYTAGVASMLQSWHNFFFVAAEPGASVSIDKPPVGLWLQAISAYFLGVNGFAMVLPEILFAAAATLVLQFTTATAAVNWEWWLMIPVVLFGVGAILLGYTAQDRLRLAGLAGTVSLVGAMMFTPALWSGLTTLNTSSNQSLPAAYVGQPPAAYVGQPPAAYAGQPPPAYSGGSAGPANGGRSQVNQQLLAYLQANTRGLKYLMAVPSSMQGSDYVIATGRPVLYLGGFMGIDPVETPASLQALVASGQLRYIYWDASGPGGGGNQADISSWVRTQCTAVTGYNTNTQNQGAPDGTGNTTNNSPTGGGFGGQLQVTLYDCAAAAG
jgi:4-amino-4-deoxy-L-arabinose transferase-like glycosyltransferase